jgi:hypothetical protein
MKMLTTLCTILLLGLAPGCACHESPLVVGKLKSGTFWKNSLAASSPSNEGGGYPAGSRVEIYSGFVTIKTSDGSTHIHPHGFYSNFSIDRE